MCCSPAASGVPDATGVSSGSSSPVGSSAAAASLLFSMTKSSSAEVGTSPIISSSESMSASASDLRPAVAPDFIDCSVSCGSANIFDKSISPSSISSSCCLPVFSSGFTFSRRKKPSFIGSEELCGSSRLRVVSNGGASEMTTLSSSSSESATSIASALTDVSPAIFFAVFSAISTVMLSRVVDSVEAAVDIMSFGCSLICSADAGSDFDFFVFLPVSCMGSGILSIL